jgi:FkbM family methyltransferase
MSIALYSQLRQDEWVIEKLQGKQNGYYVEIGAYDGVHYSNTLALEESYGWQGLLVEPNPSLFRTLKVKRPWNTCLRAAIGPNDGQKVPFVVGQGERASLYSGLGGYLPEDWLEEHCRRKSENIEVTTLSLLSLLEYADAPSHIDYLSIDVEGAEGAILQSFFRHKDARLRYTFGCMTIEFQRDGDLLEYLTKLLAPEYVLDEVRDFDAFFVHRSLT